MKVDAISGKVASSVTEVGAKVHKILVSLANTKEVGKAVLKEHQGKVLDVNIGEILEDTLLVRENPLSDKVHRVSSFFLDNWF